VVQASRASGSPAGSSSSSGSAAPGPTVQRAVTVGELTSTVEAPSGGTSSAAPRTEADLDQLADALFGRIRRQLRSEVIYEREARGLTFDLF
jgi:hypothetical protein